MSYLTEVQADVPHAHFDFKPGSTDNLVGEQNGAYHSGIITRHEGGPYPHASGSYVG